MTHQFLLEIGLEEMPARVVTPSIRQLKEKTAQFLETNRLSFDSIDHFSTPRRLAIRINGLAEKQADIEEEAKGPAKKIAQDAEGNWSKAAEGFVRGQGMTTADIFYKDIKGVEYVHVNKFIPGKTAQAVLPLIADVVKSLHFPVSMHWGNHEFKYIRPIHWLVGLLDDQVIPFELVAVTSGRTSRGHRFLGSETEIDHAANYEEKLAAQFVYVNADERQALIETQIATLAKNNQWHVALDEDLLDEVNNLVEFPTAFAGSFAEKYLAIPEEVLVTSMKEHQRYFDVRDSAGKLLPFFVSVRNGNGEYLENVVKGNEKVLTARLEDAEFFFKDDQALTIDECVNKLRNVTFHEKIGSIYEKMQRVSAIAQLIGQEVGLTDTELSQLDRAAAIYKFDLVTNMVGEFPELQGIMGEKYALMQGEDPAVAQAIREHYLPVSSEGELPESRIGAVLAVADKTDSVLSFFNVGMIPSGSNDPYALRRQTYGIIRIVIQMGWNFPLVRLQHQIAEIINQDSGRFGIELAQTQDGVTEFIKGRMKQFLSARGIRHDIIEAVTNTQQSDLATMAEAATILKERHEDSDFKPSIESLTRVMNLGAKGQELLAQGVEEAVQPVLFENEAEKQLYEAVEQVEAQLNQRTLSENYEALKNLSPLIEAYFNDTMVMAEDEAVRENRLRQLFKIARMVLSFASLDLLIVKQ
ncbi:glycine--tRNA ligase subunit beta [Vagococcus sp. BWB3-3]|uniref:Glycine--tRNA ligase beta subunit n=1 Tax=Vagococcus allomyrinae TaxID=2794353 RepID=A0A940PAN7_9ENTE|nr:glycine--tRNA ligase subunit beta [Vagococcus allomyrinae]MBP1044120.1 glycine--tRNA ligase subunit beta [Vagococcus allomyrinae]